MSSQKGSHYRSPVVTYGVVALVAVAALGGLLYWWLGWNLYWIWLIVINIVTYLFYRFDKRQSMHEGAGRIPELVLLAMTVLGGFLGAWAGMFQRPRHKVRKTMFWVALVVGTVLQIWLFFVLYL
jgi:uncharacterized membrane protein YsdA (DUF1294 family)